MRRMKLQVWGTSISTYRQQIKCVMFLELSIFCKGEDIVILAELAVITYLTGDFGTIFQISGSSHSIKGFGLIVVHKPPHVLEPSGH